MSERSVSSRLSSWSVWSPAWSLYVCWSVCLVSHRGPCKSVGLSVSSRLVSHCGLYVCWSVCLHVWSLIVVPVWSPIVVSVCLLVCLSVCLVSHRGLCLVSGVVPVCKLVCLLVCLSVCLVSHQLSLHWISIKLLHCCDLCITGPHRMRKKMCRNDMFYIHYPHDPRLDRINKEVSSHGLPPHLFTFNQELQSWSK